jgi:hypothetical protein
MGLIHKAYYQCDGCGAEFQDSDQVRVFKGLVKNGEGNKIFIQEDKMYCLNCLQFALDYENVVPETVEIIDHQELEKISEVKENPIIINDLENKLVEINNQYLKNLTKQKSSEEMEDNILTEEAKRAVQIMSLEKTKSNQMIEEQEIEKFDDIKSLEPEITNQNDSDTEQEEILTALTGIDPNYLKDSGKYLVLCQIIAPEVEEYFAKEFCKLKNLSEMKDILGNISLKGVYFSINKYIDIEDLADFKSRNAKVVNKIIFGIPNIVDLEILCTDDFAIIDKEKFNIQFEPAPKYKITDENQSDIKLTTKTEKPQSTTVVKSQTFKDPIKDVIAKLPKKKISRLNISGDDYV